MSKRSNRDEVLSKRMDAKHQDHFFDKFRVPIMELTQKEMDVFIEAVEDRIVDVFSKDVYALTLSSWHGSDIPEINFGAISSIFKNCPPYMMWIQTCISLRKEASYDQKAFLKEWMKMEIPKFLRTIVQEWNECHSQYVMEWKKEMPFSIMIKTEK